MYHSPIPRPFIENSAAASFSGVRHEAAVRGAVPAAWAAGEGGARGGLRLGSHRQLPEEGKPEGVLVNDSACSETL